MFSVSRNEDKSLTASPMFLAILESVMLAKGLSAPQHSTYFVILDEGLVLDGTPGVAVYRKSIEKSQMKSVTKVISPTGDFRLSKFVIDIFRISENIELVDLRLSPKLMMFVTDNFLLSLCDLSGRETFM